MQYRMIMMRATPEQVDSRWCWWLTWAGRIQISCRASGYLVAIAALRTSSWAGKQWCVLRIAQNKTIYIFSFWELETIEYHKMDLNGPISWWVLLSWKNRLLVTVQQTWYLPKNLHCRIFGPKSSSDGKDKSHLCRWKKLTLAGNLGGPETHFQGGPLALEPAAPSWNHTNSFCCMFRNLM